MKRPEGSVDASRVEEQVTGNRLQGTEEPSPEGSERESQRRAGSRRTASEDRVRSRRTGEHSGERENSLSGNGRWRWIVDDAGSARHPRPMHNPFIL
jgi:hypothetical protein